MNPRTVGVCQALTRAHDTESRGIRVTPGQRPARDPPPDQLSSDLFSATLLKQPPDSLACPFGSPLRAPALTLVPMVRALSRSPEGFPGTLFASFVSFAACGITGLSMG
jgi:hypothetical protein